MGYGGGRAGSLFAVIEIGAVVDDFYWGSSAVRIMRLGSNGLVVIKYLFAKGG